MTVSFPASPVLNQTYTYGSLTWKWNGVAWDSTSSTFGPQGTQGLQGGGGQGVQGPAGLSVQGTQGTSGSPGAGGAIAYYGYFYDTTLQIAANPNTGYPFTFNTTNGQNGVSVVSGSRATVSQTGTYSIQYSAQFEDLSGGGTGNTIRIWLRVNGSDLAYTTGELTVPTVSPFAMPSRDYVLNLNAGDYVELIWSTENTSIQTYASVAVPPAPSSPSVTLGITQVMYTVQGTQGVQGNLGNQGTQGGQGLQGTQGLSIQGTQGLQGLLGNAGTQGTQGTTIFGPTGPQGVQGTTGPTGPTGPAGGVTTSVIPLDDQQLFARSTVITPTLYQSPYKVTNPYSLIMSIDGKIVPPYTPDEVWQAEFIYNGFYLNWDGTIQLGFLPANFSNFSGQIMPAAQYNSYTKVPYPFKAIDILAGGYN